MSYKSDLGALVGKDIGIFSGNAPKDVNKDINKSLYNDYEFYKKKSNKKK